MIFFVFWLNFFIIFIKTIFQKKKIRKTSYRFRKIDELILDKPNYLLNNFYSKRNGLDRNIVNFFQIFVLLQSTEILIESIIRLVPKILKWIKLTGN